MMKRRHFLAAAAPLALPFVASSVQAQAAAYPTKPITLVLPYAPGNSADMTSRLLATTLGAQLGQQMVVDNRPGAGGVAAVKMLTAAAPDGYTLMAGGAAMAISQKLFKPQPYDVLQDLVPVSATVSNDVLVICRKDSRYASLQDFIQDARTRRDAVMVGISQLGTTQHLCAELFKARTGIDFTLVPFKTTGTLSNALLAGDVDVMFELTSSSQATRQTGKTRSLAISSAQRNETMPEVPTAKELGVPDFEVASWGMIFAPARTPDAIVQRLSQEIQRAFRSPEAVKAGQAVGSRIVAGSPAQARQLVASELNRWGDLIAKSKIKLG
jgi:tripartite-type tricarboxylate transporter receptor subunit TctC